MSAILDIVFLFKNIIRFALVVGLVGAFFGVNALILYRKGKMSLPASIVNKLPDQLLFDAGLNNAVDAEDRAAARAPKPKKRTPRIEFYKPSSFNFS